jgi:dihydroorotate dehydrogenase
MSLKINLFKNFTLNSPIWIASSHLTESVNSIKNWQKIQPSAVTLKTTSKIGGKGYGNRYIHAIKSKEILYCNGNKKKELLNYITTAELLHVAKSLLPNSKVGTSVLMGENYNKCFDLLQESDFFELNLKYAVRINNKSGDIHSKFESDKSQFLKIQGEIKKFLYVFKNYPCFIKLTREINWLRDCREFQTLIKLLKTHPKTGIIIANTKKWTLPPSTSGLTLELKGGIVSGTSLFEETYNLVKGIKQAIPKEVPIIATGGIDEIKSLIDIFRVGAKSVQICTAFHLRGFQYYSHLINQLNYIQKQLEAKSFEEFIGKIQNLEILYLPSQYTYYPSFYDYPLFKSLFTAKSLNILVVYARTFTRRNLENFISRFSGPNKETRIITMAPYSPMLEGTSESLGRKSTDMRKKIKESHKNWISLYKKYGNKNHQFEIYQHNKVPFHSAYVTENTALFVPYSMLGEGQTLPIYGFEAGTIEYKRLKMEFYNLIEKSELVFSSVPK